MDRNGPPGEGVEKGSPYTYDPIYRQPGERVAYSESSDVHSIGILINENAMRYAETLL